MRYVENPDVLAPLMDSSREEYLCVDFYDYLRCESEGKFSILAKLFLNNDPIFESLDTSILEDAINNTSRDELFKLCAQHKPDYLLMYLLPDIDLDTLEKLKEKIDSEWISPLAYHSTRYTLVLSLMLSSLFIKKIYIVKEKYTEEDLLFLRDVFGEECNKRVIATEGDYLHAMKEHPEITFFMIRDSKDLWSIIKGNKEDYSTKDIDDKYFLISYTSCNLDLHSDPPVFKNQDIIDNMPNVHIYTTYLYPINEDTEDSVG